MERIQRPLDHGAVSQADQQLYGYHRNDPRPNPLYDANGRQRKLDPKDPRQAALRQEWCDLYQEALEQKRGKHQPGRGGNARPPTYPPPSVPPNNRPVSSPVQPCPVPHWIAVKLLRLPDQEPRKSWWPAAQPLPYGWEHFAAQLPDGPHSASLNGQGAVRFDNTSAGYGQFEFDKFYEDIEHFFKEQLR